MKERTHRKIAFVALLVIALSLIGVGSVQAWDSFRKFDATILNDKDKQLEKLIQSEDSNIETIINAYTRETKSLLNRQSFAFAQDTWINQGDNSALYRLINTSSVSSSSIYAGVVVYKNGAIESELSDEEELKFITKANNKHIRICTNKDNRFFAAYEYKTKAHIDYYFLISLEMLLSEVDGKEQSQDDMTFLLDSACKVVIYKEGEIIKAVDSKTSIDKDHDKCKAFVVECQATGTSGAQSIDMNEGTDSEYAARIVVHSTKDTRNGMFAIAKTSNYDATLQPSRRAANRILIYGGLVVTGIALILIVLVLVRKASSDEMLLVKRRNETLEEINRKMQELSHHQRLETIGTMTAGIAHDFNNLLTPIMGYSMMTMEMLDDKDTDLQDNLMEVYKASVKAKDIVSRLAELSRKSDESLFSNIDPDELIKESLKVTLPTKPKNVDVKVSLNCNGHCINGDRTQLAQLVMNITINAYDAMAEQGGTFRILTMHEAGTIYVIFQDDGPGMTAETVAKVFDPFFTTKESGKGTGLGLAIVAQIVESHNGKIYVDSEPGKGTTLRVLFQEI